MGSVGGNYIPDVNAGHVSAHRDHPAAVAIAERYRLIQFRSDGGNGVDHAFRTRLVQNLLDPVRLLHCLLQQIGLTEFHQHPLGTR